MNSHKVWREAFTPGQRFVAPVPGHWRIMTTYKLYDERGVFLWMENFDAVLHLDSKNIVVVNGPSISVGGRVMAERYHPPGYRTSDQMNVAERISGPSESYLEKERKEKLEILGQVGT